MSKFKKYFMAILTGKFLVEIRFHEYFTHVVLFFSVLAAIIWVSLLIENSLTEVERNNEKIHKLEIQYSEKVFDLSEARRRNNVSLRLSGFGSKVNEPAQPATRIIDR